MWSPYTWHPSAMIGHHSCGMFVCAALNQVWRVLCIWDVHMCDTLSCHMDACIHSTQLSQKCTVHTNILYVGHPIVSEGCHLYRHPICGMSYHVRRCILYAWQWWGILNDLQGSVWQCCQDLCSFGCNCWKVVFGGPFLSINLKPICCCRADVTLFE